MMRNTDKITFITSAGATITVNRTVADQLIRYQALRDSPSKDSRRHAEGYRIGLQLNSGLTAEQLSQTWERVHEYD